MYRKKKKTYKSLYSSYEGLYLVSKKYKPEEIHYCFEINRENNKLYAKNGISVLGHSDVDIELIMNESSPFFGTGYHRHKSEDGVMRFGFWEVQLDNGQILSHLTIFNDQGKQNSEPYVWIKQKDGLKTELLEKYRTEKKKK